MAVSKKIAIIGAGPVGCAFGFNLTNAGHDVTIVGRGQRLADLQKNGGIVSKKSESSKETTTTPISLAGSLDTNQAWDLVLLTVTAYQIDDTLLATLKATLPTTEILFMFNTFASLDMYFNAVGKERCLIGFPAVMATFYDGALVHGWVSFGQSTIVSSPQWRELFNAAKIPTVHEPDMQSWLRTHAAAVVGVMGTVVLAAKKGAGLSWAESRTNADAVREGFAEVRKLGQVITPRYLFYITMLLPEFVFTAMLWALSRVPAMRKNPQVPRWRDEVTGLMDEMVKQAPHEDDTKVIRTLRTKIV